MDKEKIDRINELAHIAKDRELSDEEQAERAALRKEYIEDFRKATIGVLENTYVQTPEGKFSLSELKSRKNKPLLNSEEKKVK